MKSVKLSKCFSKEKNNKNILISTVGHRALEVCHKWYLGSKNYDVLLIYYGSEGGSEFENIADYFIKVAGYKYPLLYKVLHEYTELIDAYDYFFFPDDDVEIGSADINSLFNFAESKKISICQPSLNPKNISWEVTVNNPYTKHRYVKMVEIMCPLFSKEALKICLPTFTESQSGWGLEPVWAKLLKDNIHPIAIYDEVKATHLNPVKSTKGTLYSTLQKQGIDPMIERDALINKYETKFDFIETWSIYKNYHDRELYKILNDVFIDESIGNALLNSICLNMGLLKAITKYDSNPITQVAEVLFSSIIARGNYQNLDLNCFERIFELRKNFLAKLVEEIMEETIFSHFSWLKSWVKMCEYKLESEAFSSLAETPQEGGPYQILFMLDERLRKYEMVKPASFYVTKQTLQWLEL